MEGVVGYLARGMPLCLRLDEDASVGALIDHAREVIEGALEHPAPLTLVAETVGVEGSLYEVALAYQGFRGVGPAFPGVKASPLRLNRGVARRDLSVRVLEGTAGLEVAWEYRRSVLGEEAIEEISRVFEDALRVWVAG